MNEVSKAIILFAIGYVAYTISVINLTKIRMRRKMRSVFEENLELKDRIRAIEMRYEREMQTLRDQNARLDAIIHSLDEEIERSSYDRD